MVGYRIRRNELAKTTDSTEASKRAPNRLQQLKNEQIGFSKEPEPKKVQEDAGSDGSGGSKSKKRRVVLSDSEEEEEDEDFKKKKKVVAYRSGVFPSEKQKRPRFVASDSDSHGYNTQDSSDDSEESDDDDGESPRRRNRRYENKYYFDQEDDVSAKQDECQEVNYIDEKKEAMEVEQMYAQNYRTTPIREEPNENDLYCFQCRSYMSRDCFSVAQQRVMDDGRRFCLAHTSTSSFNQDYQKNT